MTTTQEHNDLCRLRALRDLCQQQVNTLQLFESSLQETLQQARAYASEHPSVKNDVEEVLSNIESTQDLFQKTFLRGTKEEKALLQEIADLRADAFMPSIQALLATLEVEHWAENPYGYSPDVRHHVLHVLELFRGPLL